MALIFITGVAGSGKSAVRKELVARGFEAYDTDNDGMTAWVNKETGEEVNQPKEEWGSRTAEWYSHHEWVVSLLRVKDLIERSRTSNIFLCGTGSNRAEIIKLADMTLSLSVDEETLKDRIATRKNSFGKQAHELKNILEWRADVTELVEAAGAVIVDTNRPLTEVVDEILKRVEFF